jgi:hypothetical protein
VQVFEIEVVGNKKSPRAFFRRRGFFVLKKFKRWSEEPEAGERVLLVPRFYV